MNQLHATRDGNVVIFCDKGIVVHYSWDGGSKRRYYPYGGIKTIKTNNLPFALMLEIVAKNLAPNGDNYMNVLPFYKSDRSELEKSIALAKSKMETAPDDEMTENSTSSIPKSEEDFIYQAAIKCAEKREKDRAKYRNIGLVIMLISICAILFACFGPSGLGVLAILSVFVGFIGFIMFGSHLKPPAEIRVPKSGSGTKEIVKGAIIGGIIAGEAGAVVGAAIAKNKLDNSK